MPTLNDLTSQGWNFGDYDSPYGTFGDTGSVSDGIYFNPYSYATTELSGIDNPSQQDIYNTLKNNGMSIGTKADGYGGRYEGLFSPTGSTGGINHYSSGNPGPLWDIMAQSFNPLGGFLVGAGGGLGGTLASGSAAKAINAGLTGALTSSLGDGSALTGGALGALGAYGPNYSSYLGVNDSSLQNALNGGITGSIKAAVNNGNVGASAISGALPGLASYFGSSGGTMDSPLGKNYSTIPGLQQSQVGEITGNAPQQSFAGWAGNEFSAPTINQEKQNSLFESSGLNDFFGGLSNYLPSDGKGWGDMAQGLAGIYQGYRQRKNAESVLNAISGRRGGYEKNLRASLQARDAASGRRSNYEGREAQLQAELARLDMGNAPLIANMNNASTSGLVGMLSSGLRWGGKAGLFGDSYNPNVPTAPAPMSFNSMPSFSLSGMGSNPLAGVSSPLTGAGDNYSSLIEMFRKSRGGY